MKYALNESKLGQLISDLRLRTGLSKQSTPRRLLEVWLGQKEIQAHNVLDVGGTKNPAKFRLKRLDCTNYRILDLLPRADYHWNISDLAPDGFFSFKWDTIFCLEMLEYVLNPYVAFTNLTNWLRQGGRLYLSFNFVYPEHGPKGTDFLRFTRNWVEKMFKNFGYHEFQIIPRLADNRELLRDFYKTEGMAMADETKASEIGYLCEATR